MRLFNILAFNAPTAGIALLFFRKADMCGQGAHPRLNHFDKLVVIHFTDRHGNHIVRRVVAGHIAEHSLAGKAAHLFGCAEDSAPRRLIGKRRRLKIIKHQIVRCVNGLFDFLHHHFFFFRHLAVVKRRVGNKIANNVRRQFQVVFQHFGIKTGKMARGIGICSAADIFNIFGNLPRVSFFRPLKHHVFNKMRNSVILCGFGSRSRIDPHAE